MNLSKASIKCYCIQENYRETLICENCLQLWGNSFSIQKKKILSSLYIPSSRWRLEALLRELKIKVILTVTRPRDKINDYGDVIGVFMISVTVTHVFQSQVAMNLQIFWVIGQHKEWDISRFLTLPAEHPQWNKNLAVYMREHLLTYSFEKSITYSCDKKIISTSSRYSLNDGET